MENFTEQEEQKFNTSGGSETKPNSDTGLEAETTPETTPMIPESSSLRQHRSPYLLPKGSLKRNPLFTILQKFKLMSFSENHHQTRTFLNEGRDKNSRATALKKVLKILTLKIRLPFVVVLIALSFLAGLKIANFAPKTEVLKTTVGKNVSADDMNISVSEAQYTNTIRLANAASNAPEGKDFLVLFTEVENASSSAKNVVYGNYFRLDEKGKKFAPLPVNAQFVIPPKATLDKQLVFIVDENKKDFNILVGDINKLQQSIMVNFK
jgi:hypothetical protein